MPKKIFIVEDEAIVALEIARSIEKLGYECVGMAADYGKAVRDIKEKVPDLVVIDIMLRGEKNGIDIAREISRDPGNIPFVYLTSVTDEKWMRAAIATEPVGYLLKPFRREELQSTLLLAFRKQEKQERPAEVMSAVMEEKERIVLGYGYFYERKIDRVFFEDRHIPLGSKESKLLRLLLDAGGKVVPFQNLEELIWEGQPVSDSTLRTLIYRLKTKLDPRLIETVPRLGCRLVCNRAEKYFSEKRTDA
ncbi:response regulator [Nitratifractor sp.]|uniref:response regulator n=1 Tax=Nitratifractor sp. TaxID=2268144 RepID=UPI0025E1A180|nr:response regulator [Nitratifractor sp.]